MQTICKNYRSKSQMWMCLMFTWVNFAQISCRTSHNPTPKGSEAAASESSAVNTMTDEKFARSLYDAAQKAKGLFSPVDFDALFGKYALEALAQNNPDAFAHNIHTRVPIDWAWKRSDISPAWIFTHGDGWMPNGGMVLLAKDVFPEGYYRSQSKSILLPDLMVNSPWLEWDATRSTYIPRKGGASARILQIFYRLRGDSTTFTLYRGGNYPRLTLPAADRNPYQSTKPEADSLYIFSSTSINTALVWSSPSVHASTIPRNELLAATQGNQPTVYVGFEYEYPEIAFLHSNQSVELFIQNNRAKLMCIEKLKYSNPNLESNLKREVDGALRSGTPFCDEKWFRGFGSGFPSEANPALTKTATVLADGHLKMSATKDQDLQEGMMNCNVKAGMKINYGMAFKAQNDQVRIHTDTVLDEWQCPRGARSKILYIDSQKIEITLDP